MHTLERVYNYFPNGFFDKEIKVLHHYGPTSMLVDSEFYHNKTIRLSPKMIIIQVSDSINNHQSKINLMPFEHKEQVITLIEDPYEKWISKPRAMLKYLKDNYDTTPEYIMYVDSGDVAFIDDILHPETLLEFYNCEMLFNCETNFSGTGFLFPSDAFYNPLFEVHKETYKQLNLEKYGVAHERGLNAGVFLGRKDCVIQMLEEACVYMTDDHTKGFPYGCMDDQYMFRYLQNIHFDKIACDVYNKFFVFAYPKALESDDTWWEHYSYFEKNYIHLYNRG